MYNNKTRNEIIEELEKLIGLDRKAAGFDDLDSLELRDLYNEYKAETYYGNNGYCFI